MLKEEEQIVGSIQLSNFIPFWKRQEIYIFPTAFSEYIPTILCSVNLIKDIFTIDRKKFGSFQQLFLVPFQL
jgi:hypothetical protein